MNQDRFQELFELHCDGALTDADCRELLDAFAADPDRKLEFIRELRLNNQLAIAVDETLPELAAEILRSIREDDQSPDLSGAVVDRLKEEAADKILACPIEPAPSRWRRFPARVLLPLAACLTLALSLFFMKRPEPQTAQVEPDDGSPMAANLTNDRIPRPAPERFAARIVHLEGAYWEPESERELTEGVNSGFVRLLAGMAKIDFTNGASVTVTGPAVFEIVNAMNTRLHSGSLSANIPESAHGFEVLTEAAQVVDLGTAFGVSVSEDGVTDVAVFEGKVEVKSTEAKASVAPKLLKAGGAVRAKKGVATLETAKFDPRQFQKSWRLAAGVVSMSGPFKFAAPGPWEIQKFKDDKAIVIFPEQNEVILTNALQVDVTNPGFYREGLGRQRGRIEKGVKLRSYLLQFNPESRKEAGDFRLSGKIRFQGRIVGLIFRSDRLRKTDQLFGIPEANYGKGRRGLEGAQPPKRAKLSDKDALRFFEDQRSLKLGLETGRDVDQVRVLVEARPTRQLARARKQLHERNHDAQGQERERPSQRRRRESQRPPAKP